MTEMLIDANGPDVSPAGVGEGNDDKDGCGVENSNQNAVLCHLTLPESKKRTFFFQSLCIAPANTRCFFATPFDVSRHYCCLTRGASNNGLSPRDLFHPHVFTIYPEFPNFQALLPTPLARHASFGSGSNPENEAVIPSLHHRR
jgi:hypothetical protein